MEFIIEYQHKPFYSLTEYEECYYIKGKTKDMIDWHNFCHCIIDRGHDEIEIIIQNTLGYGDKLLLNAIRFIYDLKDELRINNYELIGTPRICKIFKGEFHRYRF